jgi:hypothetical protein
MKTLFKIFALVIAAGYPVVAAAKFLGVHIPDEISAENVTVLFSLAVLGLILISDYGRRAPRSLTMKACTVSASRRTHEAHRLAA